ncbi:MAG TPA: hypothetical protein VEU07_12310, partial [Candidatus Acidoferrum sp.]|nr:hypothetical protein [Candidatus Acidoferrum sp.]
GWALRALGEIHARGASADSRQAEECYRQAILVASELDMRPLLARCRLGLGVLYRDMAQLPQARSEVAAAVDLFRSMEMPFWLAEAEAAMAELP